MSAYAALAEYYDELTGDVPYNDFADYYERLFREYSVEVGLVLDLCCGTGSLTCEMAARGYELIAADASADMLMRARDKAYSSALAKMPLFINQSAQELDLYGTVDAAYSSLDSLSYVPFGDLPEVFHRLRLFIRTGGFWCSTCGRRSSCAGWTAACRWTSARGCSAFGVEGLRRARCTTAWTSSQGRGSAGTDMPRSTSNIRTSRSG